MSLTWLAPEAAASSYSRPASWAETELEQIADSKSQPLVGWHLLQVGVAALARQHIALKLRLFVALQSTSKNSAL